MLSDRPRILKIGRFNRVPGVYPPRYVMRDWGFETANCKGSTYTIAVGFIDTGQSYFGWTAEELREIAVRRCEFEDEKGRPLEI